MNDEAALRDKLRKIEALFSGAGTAGEKAAAGAAADRIRARLRQEEEREKPVEIRFSLPDPWSRQMFIALCRRYGLRPYRYARMRRQSVMVRAPAAFLNTVLWPDSRRSQRGAHRISGPGHRQGDPRGGPQGDQRRRRG
jgi:hypothetical protein